MDYSVHQTSRKSANVCTLGMHFTNIIGTWTDYQFYYLACNSDCRINQIHNHGTKRWKKKFQVCMMFSCIGSVYTLLPYATNKCFGKTHFGVLYGGVQIALVSHFYSAESKKTMCRAKRKKGLQNSRNLCYFSATQILMSMKKKNLWSEAFRY